MSAGPPVPGQAPLPRLQPTATPTGTSYSCPSGYHLDDRTGQCGQDCKAGFVAFQGDCLKECPPGMTLNDDKVCIRPTFSRAFQVNESTIKSTTVVAVGSSSAGGGQLVLGSQADINKDITFQEPVSLNSRALTIVPVDKTSYLETGEISRFLIGEVMNDFSNSGSAGSCLQTIDIVRANPTATASVADLENAQTLGVVQSNTPEAVNTRNVPTLEKAIARVQAEGGPGRSVDETVYTNPTGQYQWVTGPKTIITSDATSSQFNTVPSSAAKILSVPGTKRFYVRTDTGSAQNNTIFTLTGSFDQTNFVYKTEKPALEVNGLLDLVLSGADANLGDVPFQTTTGTTGGGQFGLFSVGSVINQGTQTPLAAPQSVDFYITTTLDARVLDASNENLYPAGSCPTALQVPRYVNTQQNINEPMNEGFIVCGQPVVPRDKNYASVSTQQPLTQDGIITEKLYGIQDLNLNLSTLYNSVPNALQVTNTYRLPRTVAFDENGNAQTGLTAQKFPAQDVQNSLYIFGRGFSPKNDQNENVSDLVGPTLSQTSEQGQNAQNATGLNTTSPSFLTGTSNVPTPGLWSVSSSLATPPQNLQAVTVPGSEFCALGDLFYNAATDSIAMSFTNSSPLSTDVSDKVGNLVGLGQTKQSVLRQQQTGKPETLTVPANCINVHVILYGAGGSTENGQGGSGAQIEGDLIPSNDPTWWRLGYPCNLQIIVGGGGNSDSTFTKNTFGGGGGGSSHGVGQGGGRTAIQSLADISTRQNAWIDRIVAGGGAGSTGEGLGGNAGHFVVDLSSGKQYSQGSSGSPSTNAGQGGYIELTLANVQSKASPGQGGVTQGLGQTANSQSGSLSLGGSSAGFPAGTSSVGSGGGGGGYLGGGAAAYLGNTDNELDVPSGGGGGVSFAPTNVIKNLQSAPGAYSIGPQGSNLAKALITDRVAAGGSSELPLGAPGQAVVILTLANQTQTASQNSPTNDVPLYQSVSGFDPRVRNAFGLIENGAGDDPFRLTKAGFGQYQKDGVFQGPSLPTNPITAVFVTNTFILACEWGPLYDTTDKNNVIERFWAAPIANTNNRQFKALTAEFSYLFPNLKNVQAIRNISGDIGVRDSGTQIALLGDGIYIAEVTVVNEKVIITAREAKSSLDNESFAGKITFNDGNYNGSNGGQFVAAGSPTNVSMTLNMQLNALPQFSKGSQASDVSNVCWLNDLASGYTDSSNPQGFQPSTPSELAKNQRKKQLGFVQDNTVKMATNGNTVVAIGGYLEVPSINATGIQQGIQTGSPYAFAITNQNQEQNSYLQDFTQTSGGTQNVGTPVPDQTIFNSQNGPLIRSPSNILSSLNAGNGFNFTFSEQSNQAGTLQSGTNQGPLTNQVQLAMDQPHTINPNGVTGLVYTQFFNNSESPSQQQSEINKKLNYNLFSRFNDVAFLPNPNNPKQGQYLAGGQFTQDQNLCWLLGGLPLVGSSAGPTATINGQKITVNGVVPQNLDSDVTKTNLMNGSLWILKTEDLEASDGNLQTAVWKARPLWTTRADEHFFNIIKIKCLDVDPAIWNNTNDNGPDVPNNTNKAFQSAFVSTNLGLQMLSYSDIEAAYNEKILVPSSPTQVQLSSTSALANAFQEIKSDAVAQTFVFNPMAYIIATPAADDMTCKKDECEVCTSNNQNPVQYRGPLATVENLCLQKYLSLGPSAGNGPLQLLLDSPADSQSQVTLLDIVENPQNIKLVGPNVEIQQTTTSNGKLFIGNLLQGPYSGPDGFNSAVGPGRVVEGPENNISTEPGSIISYRVRSPQREFDGGEIQYPWIMDPFLGIPTSQGNASIELSPWDAYIEARQQLRKSRGIDAKIPKVGALPGNQNPSQKLYFGYVDAGNTDQNAFLIQRQVETGTSAVLPTQSPTTQTTAYYPGTIGTDPITAPFHKVGAQPIEPDYFQDAEAGLTFGTQDLQPMNGTTGAEFLPSMLSQFPNVATDFQTVSNSAKTQVQPGITGSFENFATLVVDITNQARVYGQFLDLDMTNFQSTEADVSPNLAKTLGQVPSTDLTNLTQQSSRLIAPLSNTTLSVTFGPDDLISSTYLRKNMVIPSVTTNFFRARNWSFYWPRNPFVSDEYCFAKGALLNDQPSLGLGNTSNVSKVQLAMSEFLYPDPFIVQQLGANFKSQSVAMKDRPSSPSLQPNEAFMYALGLSQLRFATETEPTIVYKNAIAVTTQFPVNVANLPVPSSAPGPIEMPDNTIQQPNEVAVWLAEDASQVTGSKSPLQSQCHGVYFSNAHVDNSGFNAVVSETYNKVPSVVLKVQMDIFVNCNLMNNDDDRRVFDFGTDPVQQPLWYQSMTRFVSDQGELPNNWTPLERLIFTDPMTHDSENTKNLLFSLRDLDTYVKDTIGIPGVTQLNTPMQNRVLLSKKALSLTTSKTVPRVINVTNGAPLAINAQGPQSQSTGLKVPVDENFTSLFTSDAQFNQGTFAFAEITTNLNFLRWSYQLNLPILATPNAIEIYKSILPKNTLDDLLASVVVNPVLWAPNFDNLDVNLQSKTVQYTAVNLSSFDIQPSQIQNSNQNTNLQLLSFYGLNLDTLKAYNTKSRAQKLTNTRTINYVPKSISSTSEDSNVFQTDSSLIRCDAVPLEVTYLDASYKFQQTALSRDRQFSATMYFANPQMPFFSEQNFVVDKFQANQLGYHFIGLTNPQVRNPSNQAQWPQWSNALDPDSQTEPSLSPRALSVRFTNPQSNMNAYKQVNLRISSQNNGTVFYENPYNYGMVFAGKTTQFTTSFIDAPAGVFGFFQASRHKYQLNFAPVDGALFKVKTFPQLAAPQLVSVTIPFVMTNLDTDNTVSQFALVNTTIKAGQRKGLVNQPLPNNFLCFQAAGGLTNRSTKRPLKNAITEAPFGLYAGLSGCNKPYTFFKELVPKQGARYGTQNATQSIQDDVNFMKPVEINPTALYGTKANPILIVTNPNMDIYHNGFNGAWTPVSSAGKIPCNPYIESGTGTTISLQVNPLCQSNYLDQWPESVQQGSFRTSAQGYLAGNDNGAFALFNSGVPKTELRPQLAIATVQAHNDKVVIRVSQSGWLNFPNWACQVPGIQYFQGDPRYETGAFFNNTPLLPQEGKPSTQVSAADLFAIQGNIRQIKTTDYSIYDPGTAFGSQRGSWAGGIVLTNRNQNDFVQSVFTTTYDNPDLRVPPPFGWLLTQFGSPAQADINTLLEGSFPYQYVTNMNSNSMISQLPTATETVQVPPNNETLQFVLNDNTFQVQYNQDLEFTQPQTAQTGAGTRSIFYDNCNIWPAEIVSTCGQQVFQDGLVSGTQVVLATATSIQVPTNNDVFSQQVSSDQSFTGFNQETDSQAFRFDPGGILNVTSTDPLNSEQANEAGSLGVSIYIDITRGDTLCFTQSALQRMQATFKNVNTVGPGIAAQPAFAFDSLPGATDIGIGRYQDNQGILGRTSLTWVPNVMLANMAMTVPFKNPAEGQTPVSGGLGYGAPGTMDNDEPQVICCYFTETPDFTTTNKLTGLNKVQSTSEQVKDGLVTESPERQINESACVDVQQVQPPSSYLMDVQAPPKILQSVNAVNGLVAPLMCQPAQDQIDIQGQQVPWIPQWTPDQDGLGLSLCKYDKNTYGNFNWSASWISASEDSVLGPAKLPAFSPSSPFLKYLKAFQPLCARVYSAASGNENQSPVNQLGQIQDRLNTVQVGSNARGNIPYQAAWPLQDNPKTAQANWNQRVNNSPGTPRNSLKPGGLQSPSLRAFHFTLPVENEMGVTAMNYNPDLARRNRIVLGSDTGTLRLQDFENNVTISEVPRGSFAYLVPDGANSFLAQYVNVSYIFSIVWFQKRWFVATNMGLFWTPIEPSILFLQGQDQDTLNNFVASNMKFIYLPPKSFIKKSDISSIQKDNHGFPPCTFLDKRFNGKRSVLIASQPDYAQGFFSPNAAGQPSQIFPQMTELIPNSAQLNLNLGSTFSPSRPQENSLTQEFTNLLLGGTNGGTPEVCQSFEVIWKTPNKGLNEFRQSAKFTGMPTVGGNWQVIAGQQQYLPVMINSQLNDMAILQNRVLQTSMQVPQAAFQPNVAHPAANPAGLPPNTFLFGLANGGSRSFLNTTNEILAPVPARNSQYIDAVTGKLVNWSKPSGNRVTDGTNLYGDQSIRTCQMISVTVTQPLNIAINSNEPVIDTFLQSFQAQFQTKLKNVAGQFVSTTFKADPARYSSLQGILFNQQNFTDNLLQTTTIQMAPQVQDAVGIQPGSVAIGIRADPYAITSPDGGSGINQPIIHPSQFAEITMDIYNQAFWGFASEQCMQQAYIVPPSSNPLPFPGPTTITVGFTAQPNDCCMWFYALNPAAQFNSSIFQYRVSTGQYVFEPKTYIKDSYLNRISSSIENNNQEPPLYEQIFEKIFVFKANLIFPNDSLGDIAQGPGASNSKNTSGTLAWSLGGPYSATPLQMSQSINPDDGTITSIQSTIAQESTLVLTTGGLGAVYEAFSFGLPSLSTNVVMDQNPQTTEFWAAGIGFGVNDQDYMNAVINTVPNTIQSNEFQPQPKKTPRLMICSNPGQVGTVFTAQGGVPTAASDLLPSTLNWTEVINELPQVTPDGKLSNKKQVTLLSESFKGTKGKNALGGPAKVNCFGFSPTITAVCGYSTVKTPSVNNNAPTKTTAIWYKVAGNPQWSFANFLVAGEVTAITFAGYGWYIALWNGTQSSLQFASANFTVVAIMDTWGPNQNFIKVSSFASLTLNQVQPCDKAKGFEPNPLNPKMCLKKCPPNQTAFDELCALKCPTELGYKTTDLPNECVPPRQKPKQLPPQNKIPGSTPVTEAYGESQLDPIDSLNQGPPIANFVKTAIGALVVVILIALIIAWLQYNFNVYKPKFADKTLMRRLPVPDA